MAEPGFVFIIGAAKAGTTSLERWLAQREDISVCRIKEPAYHTDFRQKRWSGPFTKGWAESMPASLDEYLATFDVTPNTRWRLDRSVDYLWNEAALARLSAFARTRPCRFICLVRDPVDRAVSEYNMTLRMGIESLSLSRALEAEDRRAAKNWHPLFYHVRRSHVRQDIHRYKDAFGSDLMVMDFHDLRDPDDALQQIAAFLDLPHVPIAAPTQENTSPRMRNPATGLLDRHRRKVLPAFAYIPKGVRVSGRRFLRGLSKDRPTTTTADLDRLRQALKSEIDLCIADPLIPTAHWEHAVPTSPAGQTAVAGA